MKLPELPVCQLPCGPGNQSQLTVMGEVLTEGLSDRGSTPLRSTYMAVLEYFEAAFLCFAVITVFLHK